MVSVRRLIELDMVFVSMKISAYILVGTIVWYSFVDPTIVLRASQPIILLIPYTMSCNNKHPMTYQPSDTSLNSRMKFYSEYI